MAVTVVMVRLVNDSLKKQTKISPCMGVLHVCTNTLKTHTCTYVYNDVPCVHTCTYVY